MSEKLCPFWGGKTGDDTCDSNCAIYLEGRGCAIRVLAEDAVSYTPDSIMREMLGTLKAVAAEEEPVHVCDNCLHRGAVGNSEPCGYCRRYNGLTDEDQWEPR